MPQCVKLGRGSGRTAHHFSSHRLHVRHLCGILDKDFWYFDTTARAANWQMKPSASCWCEGVFTWTDHLSRSAEGTWVNFMVRLFYHLALSVLSCCGNLVPALSDRRSPWTPRGESHGLDQRILIFCEWTAVCWWRYTPASSIMSLMRDEAIPNVVFHHDAGLRVKPKQHSFIRFPTWTTSRE